MDTSKPEDPRAKNNRYSKNARAKFDKDQFDFALTQFLIDEAYIGNPPSVQVSIDNLNDNIDENFLKKDLAKLGKIRTLEILRHPRTGQHLGLAKVQFERVSVAQSCVDNFHGKHVMGRQLSVFKDLRFEIIERLKEDKLNPRPPPLQKPTIQPAPNSLPNMGPHHSHLPPALNPHQPIIPLHHPHLQKQNSIGALPSPLSLDYPITTPNSLSSSAATPESSGRQRLEDRIAILMKQPNCVLSNIVGTAVPQASPTYSAFNLNESSYEYANSSYVHPLQQGGPTLRQPEKQRNDLNDHRRPYSNNHYQHHKEPYHKFDKVSTKNERQTDHNSDDEWNKLPEKVVEPLNIQLTEKQIEFEVLPYCFEEFQRELTSNLLTTIFKKLRENHGYQCLEKAQTVYQAKRAKLKIQQERERIERETQKAFERRYMSKARVEQPTEAPRPRVNLIRQRTGDYSSMQDNKRRGEADLRRVNRSSAYVAEPERRGSHNTSIDGDYSDSESSSSFSSSTSRSSSISSTGSSRSSSRSSSQSVSSFSRSSNASSRTSRTRRRHNDSISKVEFIDDTSRISASTEGASRIDSVINSRPENENEQIAISALLGLNADPSDNKQPSGYNKTRNETLEFEEEDDEIVKRPPKVTGKKRKKKSTDVIGVASEYRAAKRFASDPKGILGSFDENIENAMIDDENLLEDKPETKYTFQPRSDAEQKRILYDPISHLSEEDIEFMKQVHEDTQLKKQGDREIKIPFGSDNANKAHLNLRKHMIEGKAAEGHPKWWRGCSRCDVIGVSEKEKFEEMNYEDLTKAPIKSNVIQIANSSRRDQRGDQRRMAVVNANLGEAYASEIIKMYTTNTLQMRAKNLRFSRSKIHKWGLFACEKIASGDVVIEYVGEKIRPSLADHREKVVYTNLPTHDGSSYFFRVDCDVIDATLKGNKARFINHSCNPNCSAKVIKHDNGSNSIVIYAKQVIQADEEITYDYKFPREETDQKICCNCRAPNCQKFLN